MCVHVMRWYSNKNGNNKAHADRTEREEQSAEIISGNARGNWLHDWVGLCDRVSAVAIETDGSAECVRWKKHRRAQPDEHTTPNVTTKRKVVASDAAASPIAMHTQPHIICMTRV